MGWSLLCPPGPSSLSGTPRFRRPAFVDVIVARVDYPTSANRVDHPHGSSGWFFVEGFGHSVDGVCWSLVGRVDYYTESWSGWPPVGRVGHPVSLSGWLRRYPRRWKVVFLDDAVYSGCCVGISEQHKLYKHFRKNRSSSRPQIRMPCRACVVSLTDGFDYCSATALKPRCRLRARVTRNGNPYFVR